MIFYFIYPKAEDLRQAEFYAHSKIPGLKQAGLMTEKEIDHMLVQRGVFTFDMRRRRDELQKILGKMKLGRKLVLFDNEDYIVDWLLLEIVSGIRYVDLSQKPLFQEEMDVNHPLMKEYGGLTELLNRYHYNSIEAQVKQFRYSYLMSKCVYRFDTQKQVWGNTDKFGQEINLAGVNKIRHEFNDFMNGFPVKMVRLIARSAQWYSKWISATQTGSQLFEGPIMDWNTNQISLCYWSMFYENISQNPDAPKGDMLKNDDLVDAWLETENQKRVRTQAGVPSKSAQKHMGTPDEEHRVTFKR